MADEIVENLDDLGFKMKDEYEAVPLGSGEEKEVEIEEKEVETKEGEKEVDTDDEKVEAKEGEEEVKDDSEVVDTKEVDTEDKEVEKEVEKEEVEPQEIDTRSLIKEEISKSTDGEFSSTEELYEAYKASKETTTGKTIVESLNDAVEAEYGEGVTLSDVLEYKSRNFDEMSPLAILEEHLEMSEPGITESEIAAELRPYDLLKRSDAEIEELIEDGEITKIQVQDLKARLDRKSRLLRGELKEYQDSIDIDGLQVSSPKTIDKAEPTESEEDANARIASYNAIIQNLSDNTFEVGDDKNPESFTLVKTEEDRNGISEFLKAEEVDGSMKNFVDKNWANDDGTVNMEKLAKDVYKINSYDRDVKLAYAKGKSETSKEVKDINNLNFGKGESAKTQESGLSQAAQIAREANR